jgi:hypothetical protein
MENQMNQLRLDQPTGMGTVRFHLQQPSDPYEVVEDLDMSVTDKRALLANWASDARAVRDHPALRQLDSGAVVNIDAILSALKRLDDIQDDQISSTDSKHPGRRLDGETRFPWKFWDDDDDDPPPCPAAAFPWKPRPMLDATGLMAA